MNGTSATPGPRYQALIELLRASETLWNASRVFLARWELSPSQFNVLNLLYDLPDGCSQIQLSRQLIMHRSNVTGLVDRLESRVLLRRADNLADRRAFAVILTPAGKRLIRQIRPHYFKSAEEVWGGITAARARQLVSQLQTISANAEKIAADFGLPKPYPAIKQPMP
jgi:DNA-binding MarR family transcriptional regulator